MRAGQVTRLRALARDESGFSLVELMVATSLLAFVLVAVLALFESTQQIAPQDEERAHAVREAQTGIHAMTRELRGAVELETASPYYLRARVISGGVEQSVAYDCSGAASNPAWGKCVRTAGGTTSKELVKAFNNTAAVGGQPVFSYSPSGGPYKYVDIHLDVVVRDRSTGRYHYRVPLDDGVHLRNVDG